MVQLGVLLFCISVALASGENDALTQVLMDMEIIPRYMEMPPEGYLKVIYDQNVVVENGMELRPVQTKEPPIIDWTAAVGNFYILLMVCPDAPNYKNPYLREWVHWFVVNIPHTDLAGGEVISPHIPAAVFKDTGFLRYVFLIFQQTSRMIFDEQHLNDTSSEGHYHFSTVDFMNKYNLGRPIAAVTFKAQWDDYADTVFEQLHIATRKHSQRVG